MKTGMIILTLVLALMCAFTAFAEETEGAETLQEKKYEIAEAQLPEAAAAPSIDGADWEDPAFQAAFQKWWDAQQEKEQASLADPGAYADFVKRCGIWLTGAGDENLAFSPYNLYLALAVLSDIAEGETRGQLLSALGLASADAAAEQTASLWLTQYTEDGRSSCLPGASLWLNEGVPAREEALERLSRTDRASVFRGPMGNPELDEALQAWLNRQTGGLLSGQVSGMRLKPGTAMALYATLYFRSAWVDEFNPDATEKRAFHAKAGDAERDFMNKQEDGVIYYGTRFTAVRRPLKSGAAMVFLLPEEGVDPAELMADAEPYAFLSAGTEWEKKDWAVIRLAVPKFDCGSTVSLSEGLSALGITDAFDPARADFSGLTGENLGVALTAASQTARVTIDEEGVLAAAITELMAAGAMMPPPLEIDFVLDRPFAFAIVGPKDVPLFLGIVNLP